MILNCKINVPECVVIPLSSISTISPPKLTNATLKLCKKLNKISKKRNRKFWMEFNSVIKRNH